MHLFQPVRVFAEQLAEDAPVALRDVESSEVDQTLPARLVLVEQGCPRCDSAFDCHPFSFPFGDGRDMSRPLFDEEPGERTCA